MRSSPVCFGHPRCIRLSHASLAAPRRALTLPRRAFQDWSVAGGGGSRDAEEEEEASGTAAAGATGVTHAAADLLATLPPQPPTISSLLRHLQLAGLATGALLLCTLARPPRAAATGPPRRDGTDQHIVVATAASKHCRQPCAPSTSGRADGVAGSSSRSGSASRQCTPPPPAAWLGGGLLQGASDYVAGRVAFNLQQLSTAHVAKKIMFLLAAALPLIFIFGRLYQNASGLPYRTALYKVYGLLYRVPGIGLANERNLASYIVANAVFFAGLFSFAAMLGVVSDEIKLGIKNARNGHATLNYLSDHILVLNYNAQTNSVLRHIASASAGAVGPLAGVGGAGADGAANLAGAAGLLLPRRPPAVVILADRPKAEMDADVADALRGSGDTLFGSRLEVHTRQGSTFKLSDLRKVGAERAGVVILMQPGGGNGGGSSSGVNAEALKASTVMCLTATRARASQRVVVQMPGSDLAGAGAPDVLDALATTSKVAGRDLAVLKLPERLFVSRLIAQTAAQPGVLSCWLEALALGSSSAQIRAVPLPDRLVGRRYSDVRRRYARAVVVGFIEGGGAAEKVRLNPPDDAEMPAGARLVMLGKAAALQLARPEPDGRAFEGAAKAATERFTKERTYKPKAKHILVVGWQPSDVPDLVQGCSEFTPPGSSVTVLSAAEPDEDWPTRVGGLRVHYVRADHPCSVRALVDAGLKTADTVVLGDAALPCGHHSGNGGGGGHAAAGHAGGAHAHHGGGHGGKGAAHSADLEADARVLAAMLQVQHAVLACRRGRAAPHVVAPIRRSATIKLGAQYFDSLATELEAGARAAAEAAAKAAQVAAAAKAAAAAAAAAAATAASKAEATPAAVASASAATNDSTAVATNATPAAAKDDAAAAPLPPPPPTAEAGVAEAVVRAPEFMVPNDVVGALLTQVVAEPSYSLIMSELLGSAHGEELYLRNPRSLNLAVDSGGIAAAPVTFAEIAELARLTGQTAVGVVREPPPGAGGRRVAVLAPPAGALFSFGENDRVVVIADNY